jgi:hypothetical protein
MRILSSKDDEVSAQNRVPLGSDLNLAVLSRPRL